MQSSTKSNALLGALIIAIACCDPAMSAQASLQARKLNLPCKDAVGLCDEGQNHRPLIGIVTQALPSRNQSYIAASYVKFVEMAGGRAVPFFHDMTEEEIEERFKQVNGILLPGGGACLHGGCGYYDVSKKLLELTIQANDRGEIVPMQATCLGLEALVVAVSRNTSILGNFNSYNIPSKLKLTKAAYKSKFFQAFPRHLANLMEVEALTMENHENGISPEVFLSNPYLSDMFQILSLSWDRDGSSYVSTMEAHKYPIFATQWHPEKNVFEWLPYQAQPHTPEAVQVTFLVARNLIDLARMNSRKPKDYATELELQVYNYPVLFAGKDSQETKGESSFYQVYLFNDRDSYRSASATA